jgi:hypothetical protein
MMGTYLYCIHGDPVGVPASLVGIDGASVRAVDVSSLEAWVSDVREVPVTVSVDRMRAHDAVCAAALDSAETPLPVRFGQAFATDEAAKTAIAAKATQLSRRLRRVSGCVELRVVVRPLVESNASTTGAAVATDENATDVGRPGTAFLRRLAREKRAGLSREVACEGARRTIRTEAKDLIVEQRPCETARGVSYFALLVRRSDVGTVRELANRVLSSQSLQTLVMGPFAPYSFADDG